MKKNIKHSIALLNFILLCCIPGNLAAQEVLSDSILFSEQEVDPSIIDIDSLNTSIDTTSIEEPEPSNGLGIDSEVEYTAKDSIIMTMDGSKKVYLYGDAEVKYLDITLTAAFIELDLDSSLTTAHGVENDSTGVAEGLPVFTDKSGSYEMRTIKYNFKSEKALIEHVVTEQGEGYIVSNTAKKAPDNSFCIQNGHYSTCDKHDHPHFYLNLTKAKVIPGKKTITGPAYMVIEDIPLYPIGIPFGFVPTTSSYSSGVIFPSYGDESERGIFLKDGGYYWAASDYFDLAVTGDIYSNSSWALRTASKYKNRYKYGGNFNLQYIENVFSEKELPDYRKTKDFSVTWSHRQDAKANPYKTFSASVDFSTSSFDQNNVNSVIDPNSVATNTKRSSVSYSQRFPDSPFNFSANLLASQNSRDTSVNITAPDLTLTMNRIFPFKSKNKIGNKEAWYEKLSVSYTGNTKNYIQAKEYELSEKGFPQDWENGVKHSIPVALNLKLLKYFTVTPNFNYTERWYTKSIEKEYDKDLQEVVVSDTTNGFNRVWDYNFGASTSTKVYSFYKPWEKLFGNNVEAIRHVMTPSASVSFRPDFGDPMYGYYDYFEYYDKDRDEVINEEYSRYEGSLYGTPGKGKSGNLGLSLGNTLEMKVKSDKDSTGFKKINILEGFNITASNNFLADSLNWSRINMSGRTKILGTNINFGAVFDPYALEASSTGSAIRVDKSYFEQTGKLLRLESANLNFGVSIGSDKIKKWQDKRRGRSDGEDEDEEDELEDDFLDPLDRIDRFEDEFADTRGSEKTSINEDGYANFEIPWNLSLNYSFRLVNDTFNPVSKVFSHKVTSDINVTGDFSLTQKWKFSFQTGYNFDLKEIAHTNLRISRDLHCWGMSFNVVPVGRYKSYFFSLRVNSSLLQDLKLEKRSSPRDNPGYY